ncbi:serine/threonine-protein kinase [Pyxidicoccus sp. MSG2]|uniref:serine/threonine-protein kinase n=1 Tax=Pyxidicoccus sp. MSG2 TaxID=2996790 RepID=UPI0022711CA6|nr:serine/threonine-protein kinase [Pyxidicoccus sp. MSG2]MCY1019637.1 serine/threonine-protein kinase [Pyxidicoccus sp. MSG2]
MNASTQPARLRPFRPQPFGRYTLLSHLATGGMGEIYLARLEGAQGFEKLCVIKKILPQLAADQEFVERFVGEARTLVRLSHGSIAQVLDMGLHEDEAYMALEHVDGKDLRKVGARVRDRQVPLPLTFILYVIGRVLDALAYAHRKKDDDGEDLKLVHRDISPQNILISYEGEVKVIDFGLAKSRLSAAKTNPSIILGKFLYMSPEQARHQPVDRRSDLYAVGLCLYELICGKNPFDGVHPGELMTVVAQPKIPPLDEAEPLTPRAVTALVAKALAVEPSQRFQTAEEFRGRLQTCLMEIDASAGPESVSRFMRELFAADFQSERRLLATLKEVPRVPPGEAGPEEGGGASRPAMQALLPAKTIRLDGPVQPLSFQPTPRSRDGSGPVTDGETRPGVMLDEATRPAFPLEALEEEARARAARQESSESASSPSSSVEVRPEAFVRQGPAEPAPAPAPAPAVPVVARPATLTREVPMAVLPPEALPPVPAPRPVPHDLRPTELAMPSVGSRASPEMPWDDGPEAPAAANAESTDPRAEPLSAEPRAFSVPPPPPPPSRTGMPPVASALPAVGAPAPAPRPPMAPVPAQAGPRPGAPSAAAPAPSPTAPAQAPRPGAPAAVASAPPPAGAPARPAMGATPPPPPPASSAEPPPRPQVSAGPPPPPPSVAPMRPGASAAPVPPSPSAAPVPPSPSAAPVAAPQRTGAVMMPAVTLVTAAPPPPRTASLTAMPMVVPPPAGSTPSRGSPSVAPNADLDVVPGVAEEDDAGLAAPGDGEESAGESEMPVLSPEEMGHSEDAPRPGDGDTHPRIARPSRTERHEDTQPRVARDSDTDPRVQQRHDDTQPRVVLDEALLRDVDGADSGQEEKSGPNRPRASPRRARASSVSIPAHQGATRRTGSTPAVRSAPAPSRVDDEEDDDVRVSLTSHEETRRTPIPVRPGSEPVTARQPGENTRRTAVPARPARKGTGLLAVGLVVVLLAGAILMLALSPALRVSMGLEALPEDGPPSPRPVVPARKASATKPGAATARADTAEAGAEKAVQAPAEVPAVQAAAPAEAAQGEAAVGTQAAPAEAPVAAKDGAEAVEAPAAAKEAVEAPAAAKETVEAPAAAKETAAAPTAPAEAPGTEPTPAVAVAEEDVDSDLLAPLPAPKAAAQVKKAPPPKKPARPVIIRGRGSRETTQLQREWRDTNALYIRLKGQYSCDQLKTWCMRYPGIKKEVEAAGDVNAPDTLDKVQDMRSSLDALRKSLE